MYEVLIVDDEPLARESLKYLIDWPALGFNITAEAEDGRQALDLLQSRHFSLVLTDIRMPAMNGLELVGRLREFSDAQVVILSGYEDFEYARRGMKLGVNDYLLKPVDEDDLIEVLRRIGSAIAERQLLRRQQDLGLNVLRDQFFRKLTHGQISRKNADEQSLILNLRRDVDSYSCLLVEMDFLSTDNGYLTEWDIELKSYAVRNVLEELCEHKGYVFEDTEERYGVLLFGDSGTWEEYSLRLFAQKISRAIEANVKETISIGLGDRCVLSMLDLVLAYQSAEKALDGKFLRGNNTILSVSDCSGQGGENSAIHALQDEVLDSVKSCNADQVKDAIHRLWEEFRSGGIQGDRIRVNVLELLVRLLQLVHSYGANADELFHYENRDYERVMKAKTIDELCAFAEMKCEGVLFLLNRMRAIQPNSVIGAVKEIVQAQYHSNVSLRSVAKQVFLNPNYLGKVFKARTGLSFNEYLLQIRMNKAKQLLLHTDKKVYEIAQEVGYGELDWFYKRFKAFAGISAGEFRAHNSE